MDGNIPTNVRATAVAVRRRVDSVPHFHPLEGVEMLSAAPPMRPYCPIDVVVRNRLLLQRIATNPGGCGGSRYFLSITSSADTSSPLGTSTLVALAAAAREDPNGNVNPSSCQCTQSPTPTLLVPPPGQHCCRCIHYLCVCCRPPDRGQDGWRQALRTTTAVASMVPSKSLA